MIIDTKTSWAEFKNSQKIKATAAYRKSYRFYIASIKNAAELNHELECYRREFTRMMDKIDTTQMHGVNVEMREQDDYILYLADHIAIYQQLENAYRQYLAERNVRL